MWISTPPSRLLVFLSYEVISKFGRYRFVLFSRVEPCTKFHFCKGRYNYSYFFLKYLKDYQNVSKTPFIYMDCINSFRNFFLTKKTFNLIWEKIRTFQVLRIEFIKEIFIWVSLIFCVRKSFKERIKM